MSSGSKHKCKICKKEFSDASGLRQHTQLHSADNPYSCDFCPYTCKTVKYLSKHIRNRHTQVPEGDHECSYCGRKFQFESNLNQHLHIHTNSRPHKCDVCGKGYNSYYVLSIHKNIHLAERPFKCLYCDYGCNDKSTLRKHHERHTGIQKTFQCEKCFRNFKRKSELRAHVSEVHLNIDLKTKPCETCGKLFKTRSSLTAHIQVVHNKVYETKCDICGLYIGNRYNLKKHLRSHVNLRPFLCGYEGCGKRFKDKAGLVKHSVIHYPEQQHPCEVCGKRFARVHRLHAHMRTHQPRVKHVTCDHCGVSFYSKNYLKKHMIQKHIVRARFYCDECGFCSHNKPGLVQHIRAGHDTDLTCKICKKVSKKLSYLRSHYWQTHFIRYKSRAKVVKPKKKPKEVKVKEEPIEHPSLENIEDKHDITRGKEAEQAAKMKELMMNAVIATSDNLETLFRDLLPPADELDDDIDAYDYPLLCDAKAEEEAKEQIKEMLTRDQLSVFYGNKKPPLEKITNPIVDNIRKAAATLVTSHTLYKYENNQISKTVSLPSNKIEADNATLAKDETIANDVIKTHTNNSENQTVNSNTINTHKDTTNVTKKVSVHKSSKEKIKKVNKKPQKTKTNKPKKKTVKKNNSDVKKVKRNIKNNLIVIGEPKLNETKNEPGDDNKTMECTKGEESTKHSDQDVEENEENEENSEHSDWDAGEKEENEEVNQYQQSIILNSHQCYECFMLFDTKQKLLEHCKEHYSLCNDVMLKKCPFCDFVTHNSLPRHVKVMHNMDLKDLYVPSVQENKNETGSRYFYNVDSGVVDKIEIIPSVKNLNKMAYAKLDRLRREKRSKAVQKTKLVKKQGEWVVEKDDINIKDDNIVIPNSKDIEGDYFESLKKMATLAKKEGKKFMYPCKECKKICQTLSALKLHFRHHDPEKKPYKPKVWKHKMNHQNYAQATKTPEKNVDTKRYQKPKPIVNKHKCDPKLMEFYKNNIRGGDIEFWQFLKIYNRMDRDNVNDFKDLENTTKFGIHIPDKTNDNNPDADDTNSSTKQVLEFVSAASGASTSQNSSQVSNSIKLNTTVEVSRLTDKQSKSKMVLMLSRKELIRRKKLKQQLREKIKENSKKGS